MAVEPIIQLSNKYRQEFEESFNGLRQRINVQEVQQKLQQTANDLQPTLNAKKDETVAALGDLAGAVSTPGPKVLEVFCWSAVIQFAFGFVTILSSCILSAILGLFLEGSSTVLIAFVLLPYVVYQQVTASSGDTEQRFKLLSFAMAEGLLVGFLLSEKYLSSAGPVVFLTPLAIGLTAQLGDGKLPSRTAYLGATCGSGLALHLLVGLLSGNLSLGYLLLSILYSGAGFVALQFTLKDVAAAKVQFIFFMAVLVSQGLIFGALGGPQAEQQTAPAE